MRKVIAIVLMVTLISLIVIYARYKEEKQIHELILYGNVDVRQVDLGFRVSGRVHEIYFEEGDLIAPGSLMGILDRQPYEDQVSQARANLDSARASLSNAETVLKRRLELISDGSISQEDLDTATTNKNVFQANLVSAEASLAIAKTNYAFTELYAPTEGTVLTRIREPGTVVNSGDPIYTLSITSPVWIRAFISEPYLGIVYPGMPAEIHTDTKKGAIYKGYVGFISPVAEFTPKTVETTQLRTDLVYRLRIYAENPDRGLRQGMPVTIKLPLHPTQPENWNLNNTKASTKETIQEHT
jgi:HlyD family secretion protein